MPSPPTGSQSSPTETQTPPFTLLSVTFCSPLASQPPHMLHTRKKKKKKGEAAFWDQGVHDRDTTLLKQITITCAAVRHQLWHTPIS